MKSRPKSYSRWSELPVDVLSSVLERVSYADYQRAKIVCKNWYSSSKQKLFKRNAFPWLILFPEVTLFPEECCVVYNPEEDRVYQTKQDFSRTRFLANSGNWFLVLDSRYNLFIIDLFSGKRVNLPRLESLKGGSYRLDRISDKKFKEKCISPWLHDSVIRSVEDLRCVLWVDNEKKNGEYVVAWCFNVRGSSRYIGFCKNGEDYYCEISTQGLVPREFDMVLVGYKLYVLTIHLHVYVLDLSGVQEGLGFKDVPESFHFQSELQKHHLGDRIGDGKRFFSFVPEIVSHDNLIESNIAVTTSGEVLLVRSSLNKERHRIFKVFKKNPNLELVDNIDYQLEVESLGEEALFLDLGIIVPADRNLGIEPDCIYFTREDPAHRSKRFWPDIFVFNLGTKVMKRFPHLSKLSVKEARWFLPQP